MARPSAEGRAAALLESASAAVNPDFAVRAAACYALAHCDLRLFQGFRVELVWPGHMHEFKRTTAKADQSLAAELLLLDLERRAKAAA